jgi:hypothetical protein
MGRRWAAGALAVLAAGTAISAATTTTADAAPGAATRGSAELPAHGFSLAAAPADIWMRDRSGRVVAEHRPSAAKYTAPRFTDATVGLTLRVTLAPGPKPLRVAATLVNTDDARKYGNTFALEHLTRHLRVPTGHYSVIVVSGAIDADGGVVARMAFAVDQHITASGQTITVDLASARHQAFPTYSAPVDATTVDQLEFNAIQDSAGRDVTGSWVTIGFPGTRTYVASTSGGTYGRLISMNQTVRRSSTAGHALYFLTSGHPNAVVGDERVTVPTDALTHLERHYYSDGTGDQDGFVGREAIYPFFDPAWVEAIAGPLHGIRDEYLFASSPGVVWFSDAEISTDTGRFADMSGFRSYPPGAVVREDLWRGPLAPGVQVQQPGSHTLPANGPRTCWMCRSATEMNVGLAPSVGVQPYLGGRLSVLPGERPQETHLTVSRDGAVVFDGTNAAAGTFASAPVLLSTTAHAATYRIVETANRAVDGMTLSTVGTTEYDFTSAADSGAPLGSGWECGVPGAERCTVLPLLAVSIPLPTSLAGTLPGGFSFLVADVGHVQGAAPGTITDFGLAIRSGSGRWQPQTVESLGGGRYYVAIHNTAPAGTAVSMQWHATDAAGSSITQWVRDAYRVAGS